MNRRSFLKTLIAVLAAFPAALAGRRFRRHDEWAQLGVFPDRPFKIETQPFPNPVSALRYDVATDTVRTLNGRKFTLRGGMIAETGE